MNAFSRFLLALFCFLALSPILWHTLSSLKSPAELTRIPPTILPAEATLENYDVLFRRRSIGNYYVNSLVIACLSSLICVAAASLAAHGLSRAGARVRKLITSGLLAMAFFPPIVFLFPLYEMVRSAGLMNHPWSLIIPYAALNLPFSIWLLTGFFRQIPYELEEAAAIDGLSRLQTFTRIILPVSGPALATTGILAFIFAWNEFMFALTFLNVEGAKTITVGVATLSGAFAYEIPWGLLAAGVMASSAPLLLFVTLFQKHIVAGLTAGAGK
ncbi:MAG: carbohydrate ABC transporter permease [Bryobacteraceae bacterium]